MAGLAFDDRFAGRLSEWREELTVWKRVWLPIGGAASFVK
jgi:hypothetical protein